MRRHLLALLLGAPSLVSGAPGLVVAAAPIGLALGALGMIAAAPVQAQTVVWSATLTVQDLSEPGTELLGCNNESSGKECSSTSILTGRDFTYNGLNYRVTAVQTLWSSTSTLVSISLDKGFPREQLALVIGTRQFNPGTSRGFTQRTAHTISWALTGSNALNWSVGDEIKLSLVVYGETLVPKDLILEPVGEGRLAVSWRAPGEAVTGYEVQYTSAAVGAVADDATTVGTNPSTGWVAVERPTDARTGVASIEPGQFIGGLTPGREYRVRVRGKNAGGASPWVVGKATVTRDNPTRMSGLVWSATLRPVGGLLRGCDNSWIAGRRCSNPAVLTDDDIPGIGAITKLIYDATEDQISIATDGQFPSGSNLKLCVRSSFFALSDDNVGSSNNRPRARAIGSGSGLSWSVGDRVPLRLTSGACPAAAPRNVAVAATAGGLTLSWTAPASWNASSGRTYHVEWRRSGDSTSEWHGIGWPSLPGASTASVAFAGPQPHRDGGTAGLHTVAGSTSYDLRIRAATGTTRTINSVTRIGETSAHSAWVVVTGTTGALQGDDPRAASCEPELVEDPNTGNLVVKPCESRPLQRESGMYGQADSRPLLEVCAAHLPSDAVSVSEVEGWRDGHSHIAAHVLRWNRVLEALGEDTGTDVAPMDVAESEANEGLFTPSKWRRVTGTLEGIGACVVTLAAPDAVPELASGPTVLLSGPSGPVAEGESAPVTVTLSEALSSDVTIPLTVTRDSSEEGDHGTLTGITVLAGFSSATAQITTSQDSDTDDERFIVALGGALPEGLQPSSRTSVAVTIKDDDTSGNQESQEPAVGYTVPSELIRTVRGYYELNRNRPGGGENWLRVLIAFGVEGHATLQPFTVAEAEVEVRKWSGWQPVLDALRQLAAAQATQASEPAVAPASSEVSITAGPGVTEGQNATFTLTASPSPATDLAVTVNLSQRGDYAEPSALGQRTVTVAAGEASATFTVATVDDSTDEPDGVVTATVATGTGYTVSSSQGAATVAVADDDLPLPAIRTKRSLGREGTDDAVVFRVQLDRAASHTVTVDYATADAPNPWAGMQPATAGTDYTATTGKLTFAPGETTKTISVAVLDDVIDEGTEYFLLRFANPQGATLAAGEREVQGLIRNSDALPAAWQIRFGRTVSQQVVDGLQTRFTTPPPLPGLHLTVAGEDLTSDVPLAENQQALAKLMGFESVSSQQLVQGSSFSFSPSGAGRQLSFWGQGALSSFQGREENLTLDGDVTTALLGAEWRAERWQAGAALSHSWGDGGYDAEDGTEGEISTNLTGLFPYGRYALTPRLGIWATAGYGWGHLSLTTEGREYKPNATLTMAAGGMDGLLVDGGPEGLSLTTRADAMTVKTTTDQVNGLAASEGNVSRFRLGLEASRPFPLANGASFLPTMTIGIRQDNGDAETGFGMDLGAGISYVNPQRGISLDLKGRTLLTHATEGFQDKGMAVSFSWDPTPSNRGPSLSMSHSLGAAASGGLDALLNPAVIDVLDDPTSNGRQQFETRLAYGFPAFNDRLTLTPALGLAFSQDSTTYSLLWALAPYADQTSQSEPWELSLEGQRQENTNGSSPVDHSLKLRFSLHL